MNVTFRVGSGRMEIEHFQKKFVAVLRPEIV